MLNAFALFLGIAVFNPLTSGPRMQIVAHEDDDLLFMNPSVQGALDAGQPVVTVYLTAGDAGMGTPYWHAREAGIRAAYATMAHAQNVWEPSQLRAGEALFDMYVLGNPAQVAVLFLHLPDGGDGVGSLRYHAESLRLLWRGDIENLDSVDARQTVTRAGLVEDLVALLGLFSPSDVALSDCTGTHGWDHNDHFYSALFGLAAFNRYNAMGAAANVTLYRGYNIDELPANTAASQNAAKRAALASYMPYDSVLCPAGRQCVPNGLYELWLQREYPLAGTYAEDGLGCTGGP